MEPIWNIGYSPEFQPIEALFSQVERLFNSKRLNNLMNKTGFNADREIEAAFKSITAERRFRSSQPAAKYVAYSASCKAILK